MELLKKCGICLEPKVDTVSIYDDVFPVRLPAVIENISGIKIAINNYPDVIICQECAIALIHAEIIIEKCHRSLHFLTKDVVKEEPEEHEALKETEIDDGLENELKESLIVIEKEEPISDYLNSTLDSEEIKNYRNKELEENKHKQRRKYTRKKEGRRILTINPQADWHFKCDLCRFETDFAAYYKNHLLEAHQIEKPKIFKCKQCAESYQMHSSLRRHTAIIHERKPRPPRIRNILCSECGKKFPCRNSLAIHMHVHTGEPLPFKCTEPSCSKSYASMATLQYHKTSAHSQEKKFACEICGNTFALIFSLRSHMNKCHMGNEMQDCPNCGRSYRSRKKYEEHILNEKCKGSIHPCQHPNCKKKFTRPHRMRLHMLKMHSKEISKNNYNSE